MLVVIRAVAMMLVLAAFAGSSAAAGTAGTAEGVALSEPTGPHRVARASFHWVDASRGELEPALRAFAEGAVLDDWSGMAGHTEAAADPDGGVVVHEFVSFADS